MKNAYCPSCGHVNKYSINPPKECGSCGESMELDITSLTSKKTETLLPKKVKKVENSRASRWKRRLAEKRGAEVDDDEDDDELDEDIQIPNIAKMNVSVDNDEDKKTNFSQIFGGIKKFESIADQEIESKQE